MTFSLNYTREDSPDYEYAIDWCGEERGWGESCRYTLEWTRKWEDLEGLSDKGYEILLSMFNLNKTEFPKEKLERISPSELAKLTGINHSSDTLGDNRCALEVEAI